MIRHVSGRARDGVEKAPDSSGEQLSRIAFPGRVRDHDRELLERVALLTLDQRLKQPAQVLKVVIDDRAGDAGRARDRLDRYTLVALRDDHAEGRVDQLLAALLRRHPRRVPPTLLGGCVRWSRRHPLLSATLARRPTPL